MTAKIGTTCQIVGDDLLVTNPTRVQKAIAEKACNALLLKVHLPPPLRPPSTLPHPSQWATSLTTSI